MGKADTKEVSLPRSASLVPFAKRLEEKAIAL
jgi:hypothetical protein